MAGKAKPYADAIEGKYTYGTVNGTDYSLSASTSIVGLFDGTQPNNWTGTTVAYWQEASHYVVITLLGTCNIWRSGTSSWSGSNNKLNIHRYNETTKAYENVTNQYSKTTTAISETKWEIFASKLPAGKYKFMGGNGYRIDSEWFIEAVGGVSFLKSNEEYYIPTATYYNQETGMFDTVTQEVAYANTTTFDITKALTIGEETFYPYKKFTSPIQLGCHSTFVPNEKYEVYASYSNGELIVGKESIYLGIVDSIDSYTLGYTQVNSDTLFIVVSFDDGVSWLTYDFENLKFVDIGITIPNVNNYNNMTDEEKAQYESIKSIIVENGLLPSELPNVNWNLTKDAKGNFTNGIKFAYVILKNSYSDDVIINTLTWRFDARGHFRKMTESEFNLQTKRDLFRFISLINNDILKIDIK